MEKEIKNSIGSQLDYNLRIPNLYRKTWIIIGLVTLFLLILATISIIATYAPTSNSIKQALIENGIMKQAANILSYISYVLIASPFIFLSASWVVGIDNITKSKNFHVFIWFNYSVSALLSLISIILIFRAYIII